MFNADTVSLIEAQSFTAWKSQSSNSKPSRQKTLSSYSNIVSFVEFCNKNKYGES